MDQARLFSQNSFPQSNLSPQLGLHSLFPTHFAPSSCASDSANHCMHLQITFTYLLTLMASYGMNEWIDDNVHRVWWISNTDCVSEWVSVGCTWWCSGRSCCTRWCISHCHTQHTHTHISKLTQPTTLYFNERYMRPATCTAKARYALKL